jgi:hypothetical protein
MADFNRWYRPPDYFGECSECRIGANLWTSPIAYGYCESCGPITAYIGEGNFRDSSSLAWCLMCAGGAAFDVIPAHFCKACYVKFNGISPGDQCELCGRWAEVAEGWMMQVDNSEERLLYSAILTESEQQIYFPDFPLPVNICENCAAKADKWGYVSKDGEPEPIVAYEGKTILSGFADRSAMSSLGVLIVRDVLEAAGYETRVSGFEETHSHLKSLYRSPDPSESLVRLRSTPDLEVTDRDTANVYRVEVKTTTLSPPDYRLDAQVLKRLQNYHPDAFLLIYHIPSARMFMRKIRDINLDTLPRIERESNPYYQLQFVATVSFSIYQKYSTK